MTHGRHRKKAKGNRENSNLVIRAASETNTKASIINVPTSSSDPVLAGTKCPSARGESKIATWALCVSILIAIIYFFQLETMRDTVDQMQTQTRLAVRPFVGLDEGSNAVQNTPLHIDDDGTARLTYKMVAKNYSNAPASNVWSYANLVVADDLKTAYEQEEYACTDAVIGKPDVGLMLFPGRDRMFNSMPVATNVSVKHSQGLIWVFLTGCIGYRDQFGYLYRTKFLYGFRDDSDNVVTLMEPVRTADIDGHFVPMGGSVDEGQLPRFKSP